METGICLLWSFVKTSSSFVSGSAAFLLDVNSPNDATIMALVAIVCFDLLILGTIWLLLKTKKIDMGTEVDHCLGPNKKASHLVIWIGVMVIGFPIVTIVIAISTWVYKRKGIKSHGIDREKQSTPNRLWLINGTYKAKKAR